MKLQSKYEMDMMNANMKIEQNQQELQKVQQKIAEIQQKSEELTKVRETQQEDKFLAFEKKQPFGPTQPPKGPDFAGSMFNKRNQYATVYDRGFFPSHNMSGRTSAKLSHAGSSALSAPLNPSLTTY